MTYSSIIAADGVTYSSIIATSRSVNTSSVTNSGIVISDIKKVWIT
tara:strand:+ start:2922 stop:3059 length:138 start_codon:yes stop_codon:yes gene_type:complete